MDVLMLVLSALLVQAAVGGSKESRQAIKKCGWVWVGVHVVGVCLNTSSERFGSFSSRVLVMWRCWLINRCCRRPVRARETSLCPCWIAHLISNCICCLYVCARFRSPTNPSFRLTLTTHLHLTQPFAFSPSDSLQPTIHQLS